MNDSAYPKTMEIGKKNVHPLSIICNCRTDEIETRNYMYYYVYIHYVYIHLETMFWL